ncbi:protein of unknown function [Streptomyces murinus]
MTVWRSGVPVQFLTDAQAVAYAALDGAPSRTELERFFFLDDADRQLIEAKRRSHNRLGFAVQLTTARYLGVFLDDPTDVPAEVVDYLAEQLGIEDSSVLKAYGEQRWKTRFEHVWEPRETAGVHGARRGGSRAAGVGGRAGLGDRGGPEGAVRRGGGVAARAPCAAARRDDARPAGGLGAGGGEPAAVGQPLRAAEHRSAGGARLSADRAARHAGIGAGPSAARPGADHRAADEVGA